MRFRLRTDTHLNAVVRGVIRKLLNIIWRTPTIRAAGSDYVLIAHIQDSDRRVLCALVLQHVFAAKLRFEKALSLRNPMYSYKNSMSTHVMHLQLVCCSQVCV